MCSSCVWVSGCIGESSWMCRGRRVRPSSHLRIPNCLAVGVVIGTVALRVFGI